MCDLTGAIVASRTVPWFPVDPTITIARVEELVAHVLGEVGVAVDRIVGLGLSSAQELAQDRAAAGAFAGWYGVHPADELQTRLGIPTAVERAAIAGALAEQRFGAGRGLFNLMYVRLSAGCGVGFIVDGEPLRGANGLAGEVGHVPRTVGHRTCYCGRSGCLETVATPESVAALFGEIYGRPVTVPRLLELIRSGDGRAQRLIASAGSAIGEALAPAISLMNPSACVIGGELSLAGETLLASIQREIRRLGRSSVTENSILVRSRLAREAEVVGAAIMQLGHAPRFLATAAPPAPARVQANRHPAGPER